MRIVDLCQSVLRLVSLDADSSRRVELSDKAIFICKLWDGHCTGKLSAEINQLFGKVHIVKPDASRDNSAEIYLYSTRIKKH